MKDTHENKMIEAEEIKGPIGELGSYEVDYSDGQCVATVDLAKDFKGKASLVASMKLKIEVKDIVMSWVKSTENPFDDAAAEFVFEKLKL